MIREIITVPVSTLTCERCELSMCSSHIKLNQVSKYSKVLWLHKGPLGAAIYRLKLSQYIPESLNGSFKGSIINAEPYMLLFY